MKPRRIRTSLFLALFLVQQASSFSSRPIQNHKVCLDSRCISLANSGHSRKWSLARSLKHRMSNEDVEEIDAGTEIESSASSDNANSGKRQALAETTLPSYKKLLMFTATTIVIWLSEPLLSLVDITVVGMTSSAKSAIVQIAALGPATTLYDSEIYTTYFLAIATTNQLAPILAKKKWKELRERTSILMGLSLLLGSLIMAVNFAFGRSLIERMVGPLTEPGIVPLATNYMWIRTLVAPCVVIGCVAQAFCLTNLDTKTPAIAVLVASIVNIIGDLALSPTWGIQGAAVATALASLSSCAILANKVRKTTLEWKQKQKEEERQQATSRVLDGNIATSEAVDIPSDEIPFCSLPDKQSLLDLLRLAGPIFFVMMGKVACYSIMTLRATNFGIVNLATHNIMMRTFFFFACFGDSLGQAAQSFFPQVAKDERGKLIQQLLGLSAVVGLFNFVCSNFILTRLGGFLTKEATIIKMMRRFAHYVSFSAMIHPFIMFLEGVVLAKRDLRFLVGLYLASLIVHFGFVFSPLCTSFQGLWRALVFFQGIRLVQFATRTWTKSIKEQKLQTA
jgi:Na+-driven multidrug efflux pump